MSTNRRKADKHLEIKRRCDFSTNTIINNNNKKITRVYANSEKAKSVYLHTDSLRIRGWIR